MDLPFALIILAILAQFTGAAPVLADPAQVMEDAGQNRRGIAFNNPAYTKLFDGNGHKTTWSYNWGADVEGSEGPFEYVPMLWSDHPELTSRWGAMMDKWVHMGPGLTHALSFNEPDGCGNGGACMQDIDKAVLAHRTWMEPLRQYGDKIKIGSPAITNGDRDPVTGSVMGPEWLKRFISACNDCKIDFVALHWYGSARDLDYFKRHVTGVYEAVQPRPIWVTEFGPQGSEEDIQEFLRQAMPWMDGQPWLHRYAMQWAAPGSLVNQAGNGLSNIGNTYNYY